MEFNGKFVFPFNLEIGPDTLHKICQIEVERQTGYFPQAEE